MGKGSSAKSNYSPSTLGDRATSPTSPGGPGSPNGTGGPSQNEVLANFFQSLLSKKASSGGGAASPTPSSTSPTASGRTSTDDTRRAPMSRKDVQKELDRMRGLAGK